MFSFGIRFGEGFDRITISKLMESVPKDFDYDFLVIGSNPGGVACAREAKLAGKKTAIIAWKNFSPPEEDGFDEDLDVIADALDVPGGNQAVGSRAPWIIFGSGTQYSPYDNKTVSAASSHNNSSGTKKGRRVRQSRLDMSNELFRRGKQCRKLMQNAIRLGDLVEDAHNSGWRLTTTRPPLTINWSKMSEEVMDYVMKENWKLATELSEENVEIIEGLPTLEDNHTVKVFLPDMSENEITAALICLAPMAECILPEDVTGAADYGITCDDFVRLNEPPGKTLVVGSLSESMECAGILAGGRFPVTVVSRSKILKDYDSEISQMIVDDLRQKGAVFKEETTLTSIEMTSDNKLLATFKCLQSENASKSSVSYEKETKESFDTVLFAVGRRVFLKNFNLTNLGIDLDPLSEKIKVDKSEQTEVSNIYAVGEAVADCPEDFEVSQLAGKLLGKRLFHEGTELMNYSMTPTVIRTPTEYACLGISEDAALYRLGMECVDIYYGHFKPLDFVVPPKKGECFAKVVVLKSNDQIIGLHIYGPEAGEIIQGFVPAIRTGMTMKNFRTIVGVTATMAQEILKLKDKKDEKKIEEEVPLGI